MGVPPMSSTVVSAVSTTGILPVAVQGQDGDPRHDILRLGIHAPEIHEHLRPRS